MPRVAKWLGDAMEGLMANKMPAMKVVQTEYINPSVKKVRFKGNISGMNFQVGYAVLIRVSDTEFRNYTASFSDTQSGIVEIIFHIHDLAPGSLFAEKLQVGDEVRISMPRGMKQYDARVKQQFIFGDESSLGLACSFYPLLKKNQHVYHFYFELDKKNEKVPLDLGLENYTVFLKNKTFRDERMVSNLPLFKTTEWEAGNFILTGNVESVQTFRRVLKKKNIKGKIHTKGYWLEGKTGL